MVPLRRKPSLRLQAYAYACPGAYFVTVCADKRKCLFGHVEDAQVRLTALGEIVQCCWSAIPVHFPRIAVDAFVVMPNHLHGILLKSAAVAVWAQHAVPLHPEDRGSRGAPGPSESSGLRTFGAMYPGSLSAVVRSFKSASTRQINLARKSPSARVWQRNFHEHVIRGDDDLRAIRRYVLDNPQRWEFDEENPARAP